MSWVGRSSGDKKLTVSDASKQIHGDFLQNICNIYDIPYHENWVVDGSGLPREVLDAIKKYNTDMGVEKDMLLTLAASQPWSGRKSSTFGIGNNFQRSAGDLANTLMRHYGNEKADAISHAFDEASANLNASILDISKQYGLQSGSLPNF